MQQQLTYKQRQDIIARDGKCLECGSTENLTVDHIIPQSKGGNNYHTNLQTLCKKCNSRKGARINWSWWTRIMIALHLEEHITNVREQLRGELASRFGLLKQEFESKVNDVALTKLDNSAKLDLINLINEDRREIYALKSKLNLLEDYLKIKYVEEVQHKEFKGYKKINK